MNDQEAIKQAVGVATANCLHCALLGSDSAGSDDPLEPTWPICTKDENWRFNNLKSFPFKKDMPCWHPDFWHSKFAGMIRTGSNREVNRLFKAFGEALKSVKADHE